MKDDELMEMSSQLEIDGKELHAISIGARRQPSDSVANLVDDFTFKRVYANDVPCLLHCSIFAVRAH